MTDFDKHLVKFRVSDLAVMEGEHWIGIVRQKQITVGSLVILLRREEPEMGGVSAQEAAELFVMTGQLQTRLGETFGAERYNLIAAMMKDPWVHFHLIPRYSKVVNFNDRTWEDADWPAVASFRDVTTSESDMMAVRDALRR